MKILHILDHSRPLHSGYTFRSHHIFNSQRKMGIIPVILTSPKHEESWKKEICKVENIEDYTYYRCGKVKEQKFPFLYETTLMKKLYERIISVAKKEHPQVIHAHSPVLNGIPAILAARKLKIPVVYEIRAFWEDAAVDHGTYRENSWKYRLTRALETLVCRLSSHVTVICKGLSRDLKERGIAPEKITTIYNGIDPDKLKPVPADLEFQSKWKLKEKQIIGFIGSFYRYEGLDLLVKSFSELAKENKNLVLLLVGGGEMEKELKDLIRDKGIGDRVIMPGRVPHDKIPGIYSLFDILVYPRYAMRLTDIVTPLKPLEAMAMGKLLLASDVGGHKELISNGDNGYLFKSGNQNDLTKAVQSLISKKHIKKEIEDKAVSWVRKNHDWIITTSIYPRIYKDICQ